MSKTYKNLGKMNEKQTETHVTLDFLKTDSLLHLPNTRFSLNNCFPRYNGRTSSKLSTKPLLGKLNHCLNSIDSEDHHARIRTKNSKLELELEIWKAKNPRELKENL